MPSDFMEVFPSSNILRLDPVAVPRFLGSGLGPTSKICSMSFVSGSTNEIYPPERTCLGALIFPAKL
jgi:hypothetical protein